MPVLKDYRYAEWQAKILEGMAMDTLSKTRVFNASADDWRLLRPEDIGLAEGVFCWTIPPLVTTVQSFTIPAGQGWTFFGWWLGSDLGCGSYIFLKVNGVKRQEVPGRFAYQVPGYSCCPKLVMLEQMVYVKQNDKITMIFNNTTGASVSADVFPEAVVAGESKQLLITV